MRVEKYRDAQIAAKDAAQALEGIVARYEKEAVLVLLAGGSALRLLEFFDTKALSSAVTITVTDERFAKSSKLSTQEIHTQKRTSNFAAVAGTPLFQEARAQGAHFLDTRTSHDTQDYMKMPGTVVRLKPHFHARQHWEKASTLESMASRMEKDIKDWKLQHKEGKIIITQGIGEDGHTAGIMPYPEDPDRFEQLFEDRDEWVVGYDAGMKSEYSLRTTVTMPFLREAVDYSIVYVVGEAKRSALTQVMAEQGRLAETPARIVREMKNVTLFTDLRIAN